MIGINGVLTFKKSALPEVLRQIPIERVVLETDAPYLSPVPHRGKRNESAYIRHTVGESGGGLRFAGGNGCRTNIRKCIEMYPGARK